MKECNSMSEIVKESVFINAQLNKHFIPQKSYELLSDKIPTIELTIIGLNTQDIEHIVGTATIFCVPWEIMRKPQTIKHYDIDLEDIANTVRNEKSEEKYCFVLHRITIVDDFRYEGYGSMIMEALTEVITDFGLSQNPTITLLASAFEKAETPLYDAYTQKLHKFYEKFNFSHLQKNVFIRKGK